MQFEDEKWAYYCDSICPQQTLKIHKKIQNRRNSLQNYYNCIIVYYNNGLKHKKDFYHLFEKFQFHFKFCNTGGQWLRVGSPPWSPLLTLVALTFWLEVASSSISLWTEQRKIDFFHEKIRLYLRWKKYIFDREESTT